MQSNMVLKFQAAQKPEHSNHLTMATIKITPKMLNLIRSGLALKKSSLGKQILHMQQEPANYVGFKHLVQEHEKSIIELEELIKKLETFESLGEVTFQLEHNGKTDFFVDVDHNSAALISTAKKTFINQQCSRSVIGVPGMVRYVFTSQDSVCDLINKSKSENIIYQCFYRNALTQNKLITFHRGSNLRKV